MKLYTEEQVRLLLDLAKLKLNGEMYSKDVLLQQVLPIQLPSDEEIQETNPYNKKFDLWSHRWDDGAKWMREQIQGGNK